MFYLKTKNLVFFTVFMILFSTSHCGIYKKTDARKIPPDVKERVQKNIDEGRGISFGKLGIGKGGGGTFDFASSNEMWRASIDILDFVSLTNASYSGGIIITDWFGSKSDKNRELKITVKFLSNEIRPDGIDIIMHEKICENESNQNCKIKKINSPTSDKLKFAILKKAAFYKTEKNKKKKE